MERTRAGLDEFEVHLSKGVSHLVIEAEQIVSGKIFTRIITDEVTDEITRGLFPTISQLYDALNEGLKNTHESCKTTIGPDAKLIYTCMTMFGSMKKNIVITIQLDEKDLDPLPRI